MATTNDDLRRQIGDLKHDVQRDVHDIRHDIRTLKELLMTLQGSTDRLGAVVQKILVDAQTTQTNITNLQTKLDDLIAQGSADASELADLRSQVATAVPQINANVEQLEALDASVQDPANPIDPEAPVDPIDPTTP